MVKISNTLFRDFKDLNQIDNEESENRCPEALRSILKAPGLMGPLIISKFQSYQDIPFLH